MGRRTPHMPLASGRCERPHPRHHTDARGTNKLARAHRNLAPKAPRKVATKSGATKRKYAYPATYDHEYVKYCGKAPNEWATAARIPKRRAPK